MNSTTQSRSESALDSRVQASSVSDLNSEDERKVITSIIATDLALGLRRIPVGFYAVIQHSGLEWRTKNMPTSVNNDVIEWDEPIPIPSDLSTTVSLEVCASFEFHPMLGNGEQLRKLTTTVRQLLSRSAENLPFTFFSEDGDIVSPCLSLLVIVGQWKHQTDDPPTIKLLDPHRSTGEPQGELETATDKGHLALSLYRKHGNKQDLECSIEHFGHALNICPVDDLSRAAAQSNLAMAKFIHCQVYQKDTSLDAPLRLYSDALQGRPVGHVDRPMSLIQFALLHLARFEESHDEADITETRTLLHEAIDLFQRDAHGHQVASIILQSHLEYNLALLHPLGQSGTLEDNTNPTNGDLWTLSEQLLDRHERFGDLADLQQSISYLEILVKSTPLWDVRYLAVMSRYGCSLFYRFYRLGALGDLELAISSLDDAIRLTPDDDPSKPGLLNNFGMCHMSRFEHLGQLNDLERAILVQDDAVRLTPDGHPDKPRHLNNLSNFFRTRFERLGELSDLEQAILGLADAIRLTPDDHPDKPFRLNSLGVSLVTRFERLGELGDLERAISSHGDAVRQIPDGHSDKPRLLNSLGVSFATRFEHLGDLDDLTQAISCLSSAILLTPDGHPDKPGRLTNLGNSFFGRFRHLGELSDLEQAISNQADAVWLTPCGHPNKPRLLNNLGNSLRTRFQWFGKIGDLEQAISSFSDAVQLIPDGHPQKPSMLNNLGISFRVRFQHLGDPGDIERAISFHSDAVRLTPDGHPNKPDHLRCYGNSLSIRFEHFGELSDLEQAILSNSSAVRLTPNDHPDNPSQLNDLGICFFVRFERLREPVDLERAISSLSNAVRLTPDDHPSKPYRLNNLGISFGIRFQHFKELSDLEQSILNLSDAVRLTPEGHTDGLARQYNLGILFRLRFEVLGEPDDLERAISNLDVVRLMPDGHPNRPRLLENLGISFGARFRRLEEPGDLDRAISSLGEAVRLTPDDQPHKYVRLIHLADCFGTRFVHFGDHSDFDKAILLYSSSASNVIGSPSVRFRASQMWISRARTSGDHSLLHAYSIAIGLLSQLAWIGLSLPQRIRELAHDAGFVREAAAVALDAGLPEVAVEWLEQGRSIVWGELFQLRSSYDELFAVYPDHAQKLRDLSNQLELAGAIREQPLLNTTDGGKNVKSSEDAANRHRALAIERDELLREIRTLPGFERFLLHKEFSQFRASARSGPIVILNAAKSRCDALIILADVENVIHVPLPGLTPERPETLQTSLNTLVREAHDMPNSNREGARRQSPSKWQTMLSSLWQRIVKPVLDSLALVTPGKQMRIFWCPTGPLTFLPIHAAGFYDAQHSDVGHKIFDFVVSSYTPTLSVLAPSPKPETTTGDLLRLLAVPQPSSDGLSPLQGVGAELRHIGEIVKANSSRVGLSKSSVGTVDEVLELMKEADWVHFACHGIQDPENPTESGLCLADARRLRLADIMALSRSRTRGGLAFLSACQTATGDKMVSDEALHVAAGMLLAGYGGVVGTMWSISDRIAPEVARGVYERLFSNGNGSRPDYRDAARALQDAVARLRNEGAPFSDWIPFIHVGL